MKNLLITFSGGQTSAYMTWMMLQNNQNYNIKVVFANTGKEREETLKFVNDCDLYFGFNTIWIEAVTNPLHGKGVRCKIVDYETASRNGEPFEAMIAKHGLPNRNRSLCTRELKTYAVRAYARSIGWKKYHTAIGIRADEAHRINPKTAAKERLIYPLYVSGVTKDTINSFWNQQTFRLNLKSYQGNCDFCWKKSWRKLLTLAKENPEGLEWWERMEKKYEKFTPASRSHNLNIKPPHRFFRENKTVEQLRVESRGIFELATDDTGLTDSQIQMKLFTTGEYGLPIYKDQNMDSSNGCEESCEAF